MIFTDYQAYLLEGLVRWEKYIHWQLAAGGSWNITRWRKVQLSEYNSIQDQLTVKVYWRGEHSIVCNHLNPL